MRDSDECMASTLQFGHVRDGRQKNLHNLSLRWKAHICLVSTALAVLSLDRRLPNLPQGKWRRERAKVGEAPIETNSMISARCRPRGFI